MSTSKDNWLHEGDYNEPNTRTAPLWWVLIGVLLALIFFGLVVALVVTSTEAQKAVMVK